MPDIADTRATIREVEDDRDTKLTLYYIGNCSSHFDSSKPTNWPMNYDDRSWAVCFDEFKTPDRHHYARHNLVLGSTDELYELGRSELARRLYTKHQQLRVLRDTAHAQEQTRLYEAAIARAIEWADAPPTNTVALLRLQSSINDLHRHTGLPEIDQGETGRAVMDEAMNRIQTLKGAPEGHRLTSDYEMGVVESRPFPFLP